MENMLMNDNILGQSEIKAFTNDKKCDPGIEIYLAKVRKYCEKWRIC